MKMRYGNKYDKATLLKFLWEKKHIMDAGFIDYYLMAFWIFHLHTKSAEIGFWARGAMSSSIICYCLGLTEVDPMKYGLHSVRFVNDNPPKFQFDIERPRFEEFMKEAERLLQANAGDYDIPAIKESLFYDLTPMDYLSKKNERPLPENLDDELARYALNFPQTLDLYDAYIQQPSTFDRLIYQEEMLDILRDTFHVFGTKADSIRLAIQRRETEQVEAYKLELFANLKGVTPLEAETAWQRLISNPNAFLKAHAVSRVLAKYKFEF
jgi:DNA polymerase III alpha subunit